MLGRGNKNMKRAEIARAQTNKQREIIENHRVTLDVFSKISESVSNGEYTVSCIIPTQHLDSIKSKLEEEGFLVTSLSTNKSELTKIVISW